MPLISYMDLAMRHLQCNSAKRIGPFSLGPRWRDGDLLGPTTATKFARFGVRSGLLGRCLVDLVAGQGLHCRRYRAGEEYDATVNLERWERIR